MKKAMCILFALLMTFSVCGISASAVATPITGGSSMSNATIIPNYDVDYVSSLDAAGEEDWFKFTTLPDDAYYFINSKNYNISNNGIGSSVALHVHLYDVNGQEIITSWGDATKSFSMNKKLEPNTVYYLRAFHANRATGNYQIGISYQMDPIPNEMKNASLIQVGQKYVQSLDGPGDVDWYQFSAPVSGEYVIASKNYNISNNGIGSSVALHVHLYDRYSQELKASWGDANATFSCKADLEKGQQYFIRVFHASNAIGTYEFSVSSSEPAKTLESISIWNPPYKMEYYSGESFDKTGMVVRARYSDGTTQNVSGYSVLGFNSTLPAGTQTLTVSYTEGGVTKTTTFTIRIIPKPEPKTLASISVKGPSKTRYKVGEAFDPTGMEVTAKYSDGSTELLNAGQYTVTGYDAKSEGTQTLTVTAVIDGVSATATFTVTVRKPFDWQGFLNKILQIISMLWTPMTKLIELVLKLFSSL